MSLLHMTPSEVLAASCYTRGLWSPASIWHRLAQQPYRGTPHQWGLDLSFVRLHLARAFLVAWSYTGAYILLLLFFAFTRSVWLLIVAVLLMFVQWEVVPWAVLKFGYVKRDPSQLAADPYGITTILCKDATAPLPDLGFLIRDAIFSVDCTARDSSRNYSSEAGTPTILEFYKAIFSAAKDSGFHVLPLAMRPSRDAQPGGALWGPWYRFRCLAKDPPHSQDVSRLVIVGEQKGVDGFAAAEVTVKEIGPHLSFVLRLRFMPPLRQRLHHLAHLAQEHTWWRGLVLPAAFLAILLAFREAGRAIDPLRGQIQQIAPFWPEAWSSFDLVLLLVFFILAFGPLFYLAGALSLRVKRYVWGAIRAATGTFFEVDAPVSFRFSSTRVIVRDGEESQSGSACLQIMQEVLTNCIINVLHRYGIDTRSIREEVNNFINQGIYMTGGNIAAQGLAVGAFAAVWGRRRIKQSRSGKRPVAAAGAAAGR